jgi:uncharacterized membrane protein YfcA
MQSCNHFIHIFTDRNHYYYIKTMNMSVTTLVLLCVIGIITGVMAGMLGIGGAIIMIPALVFILGFNQQMAQGTSLAVMLPPIGIIAITLRPDR